MGRLNALIWALLVVLAVLLVLSFIFDFGAWSWALVVLMAIVFALDFVSRQRRRR